MSIIYGIIFIIISFIQFIFAGYFFYRSNEELKGLKKLTKNDMPRSWGIKPEIYGGDNFAEIAEKLNGYIDKIKKTNKNLNFSSGIVTIFSAFAILISGIILIIM